MSKPAQFEQLLRPVYEARAVISWGLAALWCLGWALGLSFATGTILLLVAMCVVFGAVRLQAAVRLAKRKLSLIGQPVRLMTSAELMRALPKMGNNLWLGWGYRWEPSHTQRAHEVMQRDMADIYPPEWALKFMGVERNPANERGLQWIHGLEPQERDVLVALESLKGHCAVIATTRAIKTKLMSLIVPQLAAMGDVILAFDPKGDKDFREILRSAAQLTGDPERFLMLHPAFASQSVRMDLLKNWDRVSQVASRVSLVLGSQDDSTFKEFCWKAVHSITSGMKYVGRRVSLASLKNYMESRVSVERLTEDALGKFFKNDGARLKDRVDEEILKLRNAKPGRGRNSPTSDTGSLELLAMMAVFNVDLAEDASESRARQVPVKPEEIRGLIAILEANKEWFSKMIVSITPMLTKLSTDDLRDLLSPDYENPDDLRPIMDTMRVIKGGHLLYVGSDTLADPSVGHALNAMILADVAAVAAELYNHGADDGGNKRRIHLIVDEWRDSMCEPLVQLANKGGGANIFIWALGQTFPDLVDAFGGNQAKAHMFMGNMNNLIVGATSDSETMTMVSEKFGMTTINMRGQSQSTGSKTEDYGLEYSVNRGEVIKPVDTELFPPSLLPGMPDLQYIAIFNRSERIKGRIPVLTL